MVEERIDVLIIFNPELATLACNLREASLGRQAVRCLELLINRPGETLSKEEFITQCWKPYGSLVTDNSVRQVFFQLRRALDEVGAPPDILVTLPRQGYCLKPGSVKLIEQVTFAQSEALTQLEHQPLPDITDNDATIIVSRKTNKLKTLILIAVGGILFFAVAIFRWSILVQEITYTPAGEVNGVNYFIQKGYEETGRNEIPPVTNWLNQKASEINDKHYIYINRSETQNLSFFACRIAIQNKDNDCAPVTVLSRKPQ